MKALSIRQPFASLIIEGLKDREHRTWNTKFRGRFIVHASKNPDIKFMEEYGFKKTAFTYGVILGTVELYDTEDYGNGIKGLLLRSPTKLSRPIEYKGQLSFFDIPIQILEKGD